MQQILVLVQFDCQIMARVKVTLTLLNEQYNQKTRLCQYHLNAAAPQVSDMQL